MIDAPDANEPATLLEALKVRMSSLVPVKVPLTAGIAVDEPPHKGESVNRSTRAELFSCSAERSVLRVPTTGEIVVVVVVSPRCSRDHMTFDAARVAFTPAMASRRSANAVARRSVARFVGRLTSLAPSALLLGLALKVIGGDVDFHDGAQRLRIWTCMLGLSACGAQRLMGHMSPLT